MGHKADVVLLYDGPEGIVLKDMDAGGLSITNDAERVVANWAPTLNGRRLFYFDSVGDLDELRVEKGRFAGFSVGASTEIKEALYRNGYLFRW
jgi:hypothetical protein